LSQLIFKQFNTIKYATNKNSDTPFIMAAYGSLVQLAITMGQQEVAGILRETLEEEKQTDENLTMIAENNINWEAEQEDEEGEEEGEEEEE
jgi:hypothetical protein